VLPISELAAATVANLAYLTEIAMGGRRTRGGDRLIGSYDRLKTRLTSQIGQEVLASFEQRHAAPDAQAALRQALQSRLAEDPAFRVELDGLVEEVSPWM
jgi:hypothetical protein